MTFVWLAVALAFGVAEMLTLAFYAVFLVAAALAAAVAALLGVPEAGQIVVFCGVSVVGVVTARPPLMRYLKRGHPGEIKSGAQAMVGMEAPVVEEIRGAHEPGHVRVAGESWPAISADGSTIAVGSTVHIDALRQATLIVSLVATPSPASESPTPAGPEATPTTADTTTEG
ncbi:MAG TPA: NfeD family protein [Candidatus Solibacter sp.]|jgi:membrane protein implicated in regulation of membrane protease activity|nr:NfeD family protein [Candidatus Solibacter sp.]